MTKDPALWLAVASWAAFALAAFMLRTPSPLLLALVPAQIVLGLASFFPAEADRRVMAVTAALLLLNFGFLFKQAFLGG